MLCLVSGYKVSLSEQLDKDYTCNKSAHVRPKRYASTHLTLAPARQQAANYLDPDPVEEHRPCGQRYGGEQKAQGHHHKHTDTWVED